MIPGDAVLDAFINANILFAVALLFWIAARFCLQRLGAKHAYGTQLRTLNAIFLTIVFSPFLVLLLNAAQGWLGRGVNLNLSDKVVAYYLNGGFQMEATRFEQLLVARDTFITDVINLAGWLPIGVVAMFLVGLAVGVGRLLYSVFCLNRIVASSYAWRRFGRVQLRLSDRTLVPFSTRGLRNYYVVIPSHMLGDADALRVSIAHEFQHLRQGDIEWEILLEALKPLFFLNPAYHAWKRQVEHLRELSCDSAVLNRGRIDVRAYCETLLNICQKTLRKDRMFVIAVPKVTLVTADRSALHDGKRSFLETRILTLLDARRLRRPRLVFGVMCLPLICATMLTTMAIQRPADWSQDRLTLSTVVNLERLEKINRLSAFGRIRD